MTALPAPPATTLSSVHTSVLWLSATLRMHSTSSGLTKRMLTTVALKSSATCWAVLTMAPNARMAMSLPSLRTSAFPIGRASSDSPSSTPGPLPRGYLTALGPLWKKPALSICLHSRSSAGVISAMFGRQRKKDRS